MEIKRICIYPADAQRITGISGRSARRLMAQIRQHYQKQNRQYISLDEFCRYTGLNPDHVKPFITD